MRHWSEEFAARGGIEPKDLEKAPERTWFAANIRELAEERKVYADTLAHADMWLSRIMKAEGAYRYIKVRPIQSHMRHPDIHTQKMEAYLI